VVVLTVSFPFPPADQAEYHKCSRYSTLDRSPRGTTICLDPSLGAIRISTPLSSRSYSPIRDAVALNRWHSGSSACSARRSAVESALTSSSLPGGILCTGACGNSSVANTPNPILGPVLRSGLGRRGRRRGDFDAVIARVELQCAKFSQFATLSPLLKLEPSSAIGAAIEQGP
jgi:hypothetical protein